MKNIFISLIAIFLSTPAVCEVIPDDWLGLWIGEGQIGDFPDFGTFSLGDDYILIKGYDEEMNLLVTGQTHFNLKRYGDVGGKGVVSGQTMTVKGYSHSNVRKEAERLSPIKQGLSSG